MHLLVGDLSLRAAALVAGGAVIGALARWALGVWLNGAFPYGTALVNVLGSFLIGLLLFSRLGAAPDVRLFFATGMLGAFTTMSAFAYDTIAFVEAGERGRALLNIVIHPVLCLLSAWAGRVVAMRWF